MKKSLKFIIPAVALAGLAATTVFAAASMTKSTTNPPVTAPPVQGHRLNHLVITADTVIAAGPGVTSGCSQANLFKQGQKAVFRMWGVDSANGGYAITPKNVQSAVVKIPGLADIPMTYGAHGSPGSKVAFWTAVFDTTNYPLGLVDFTITVTTYPTKAHGNHPALPALTGTFSQHGFAMPSRLTVTPAS